MIFHLHFKWPNGIKYTYVNRLEWVGLVGRLTISPMGRSILGAKIDNCQPIGVRCVTSTFYTWCHWRNDWGWFWNKAKSLKFPFPPAFGAKLTAPEICRLSIYRHFVSAPLPLSSPSIRRNISWSRRGTPFLPLLSRRLLILDFKSPTRLWPHVLPSSI